MTDDEVLETIRRFNSIWPDKLTESGMDEWIRQCEHIDAGFGEAATNALLGESTRMPVPADFRKRAESFAKQARLKATPAVPELPPGERWSDFHPKDAIEKIRKDMAEVAADGPPVIHPKFAPAHRKVEYANHYHAKKHFGPVETCHECAEFLPKQQEPESSKETA